jgi:hypothetical protein
LNKDQNAVAIKRSVSRVTGLAKLAINLALLAMALGPRLKSM